MKIVILPSLWWSKIDAQAEKEATPPGDFPRRMMRWLEADGHEIKVIEPTEGWLNPYPNQSFLRGLDPLRALKASTGRGARTSPNLRISSRTGVQWAWKPSTI